MLRIIQLKSVKLAKQYFSNSLQHGDYYVKGSSQERSGVWGGSLAKELGLTGQVTKGQFVQMCENINPVTGEKLTLRSRANRTPGYDLNFHVPKSVSIVHALTLHKEAIEQAFQDSVQVALEELEQVMATRVRKGNVYEDRTTSNMAWAEFVHYTARPVDGIPDPHLHAHYIGFNATKDQTEGVIKAGKFTTIKEQAPLFEAVFHRTLQDKLVELGFGIRTKGKYWEIDKVSEAMIGRFSRRKELIDTVAKEQGIRTDRIKDTLGAKTRQHKAQDYTMDELKSLWSLQLASKEKAGLTKLTQEVSKPVHKTPAQALDFAINHHLERQSVVRADLLLATALRYGSGVTLQGLRAELGGRQSVLQASYNGRSYVTTSQVLKEEQDLLGLITSGQGKQKPLMANFTDLANTILTDEQQKAVHHVLNSKDSVISIQGGAGTGKTTLMTETVQQIQQTGKRVFAFAPSSEASKGVLRSEGFDNADTVAQLLQNTDLQNQLKNQILWIDEAGLLSIADYTKALEIARQQNARVIVTGDVRQHSAVSRGQAHRLLQEHKALNPATLTQIQRQKDPEYKKAVQLMSEGKTAESFTALEAMGAVREITDSNTRYQQIALDYVQAIKNQQSVLLVAPTHKEGLQTIAPIRSQMRQQGLITGKEYNVTTRVKKDLTQAQKLQPQSYEHGQVIRFHRDTEIFQKGLDYSIEQITDTGLKLKNGQLSSWLPLSNHKDFGVFEPQQIQLATGDQVRFNENGKDDEGVNYHNGNLGRVLSVQAQKIQITLENGYRLSLNSSELPLTSGYYSTSYSSQGKTVDRVILAQFQDALPATNQKQWYVSISRGRDSIGVYTDNTEALKQAIDRTGDSLFASDLFANIEEVPKGQNSMTQEQLDTKLTALKNRMQKQKNTINQPIKEPIQEPKPPTQLELLHRVFKVAGIKPSKDDLLTRKDWELEKERELDRERDRDFER